MARSTRGRQKLEMVKMQNESNRRVTFSKRRAGLFKKASELISLCAVEIALIVFSPMGKVYTFGHPTLQTIIQKYLRRSSTTTTNHQGQSSDYQNRRVDRDYVVEAERAILSVDLNHEMKMKENLLERERRACDVIGQKIENSPLYKRWSRFSVNELNLIDLFQFKAALERLKMEIDTTKVKNSLGVNYNYNNNIIPDSDLFFGFNKINYNNNILPFDQLRDSNFTSSSNNNNFVHQNVGEFSTGGCSFRCSELDLELGHGGHM